MTEQPMWQPPPPPSSALVEALPPPIAVHPVPGTPFGIAVAPVPPTASGPASASLVTGIGSVLVALIVAVFGLAGAEAGWGPTVAGAFAVLSGLLGGAAVLLGVVGMRQVKRAPNRRVGFGVGVAGTVVGGVGIVIMLTALIAAVGLSVGSPG